MMSMVGVYADETTITNETTSVVDTDSSSETNSDTASKADTDSTTDSDTDSKADTDSTTDSDTDSKADTDSTTDSDTDSKADTDSTTDSDTDSDGDTVYELPQKIDTSAEELGDWGSQGTVDYKYFKNITLDTDMVVTVDYKLTGDKEYYLLKPMDYTTWGTIKQYISGIDIKEDYTTDELGEREENEGDPVLQDDGFIIVYKSEGTITFTISADGVARLLENADDGGWGGLSFQTYGVEVSTVTLAEASAPVDDEEHSFDDGRVTKVPTCTEEGVRTHTCTICGDKWDEILEPLGHDYSLEWTVDKEATCTEEGSKSHHCTACDDTTDVTAIKKIDHNYKSKVVAPTYTAKGYTLHTCSVCGDSYKDTTTAKLVKKKLSKATATISKTKYGYTGKAITPKVTVKYGKKTLKKGTDYTVTYKNNKNTGKATITIKGKGAYTGTITKKFYVVPKKATVSSVKSTKTKTVKVTWKKDKQASGYQVVYSTSSKFKSAKSVTVKKNTKTSATISKLTKGKTYYVKVRSYKTVGSKKVYGAYSKVKKVTCK